MVHGNTSDINFSLSASVTNVCDVFMVGSPRNMRILTYSCSSSVQSPTVLVVIGESGIYVTGDKFGPLLIKNAAEG